MRNALLLCSCVVGLSLSAMGCSDEVTFGAEGAETSARGAENFQGAGEAPPIASGELTEQTPEAPTPAPGDPVPGELPGEVSGETGACPDFASFGQMPECCGGTGSCVPMDALPASLQPQVSTCDGGGACVPNGIIESIEEDGGFWPLACESIGGAEGVCLSTCIPKVGEFAALLPQDVCQDEERCAPCIDPLTGEDSGACGDGLDCFAGVAPADDLESSVDPEPTEPSADPEPATDPEPAGLPLSCDNLPTEPVVDPTTFASCGTAAHCVPAALVGVDDQENLAPCATGFCVPDVMIASGGYFVPDSCTSVGGMEGRCLNTVLPAVAELVDTLPVASCEPFERCSPCCDPMTGLSTDVCDQGCDLGPEEVCDGVPIFPPCCGGVGHCIDPELVPDALEGSLAICGGDGEGLLCVPDEMQDLDYAGDSCLGDSLLLGQYEGVCLPQCLDIFLKISFDKSPCSAGDMCVPCEDPVLGGPTGAPGCDL